MADGAANAVALEGSRWRVFRFRKRWRSAPPEEKLQQFLDGLEQKPNWELHKIVCDRDGSIIVVVRRTR
jgi:hypothetical protein